jgi:hypothetical protein
LRLLVFTQGGYGERVLDNLRRRAPEEWTIEHEALPEALPPVIEEPEKHVSDLKLGGEWDLVLFLGESPSAFSLLPAVVRRLSAKAVVAPVDDYSWLPLGLERQIRSELEGLGVKAVFPRTFCTLKPVGVPPVDEFARIFGSPRIGIVVEGGKISRVDTVRGAPCGSTWYMTEKLPGTRVEEAAARAAILVQIYPCLASRRVERLFGDAPIHVAGHLAEKAVEDALKSE